MTTIRNPYRVGFGTGECNAAWFETFAEALALGRELQRLYTAEGDPYKTVGLYRDRDGGGECAGSGLTSEELDRWLFGDEAGDAAVAEAPAPCDHCGSVTGAKFGARVYEPGTNYTCTEERCSECVKETP